MDSPGLKAPLEHPDSFFRDNQLVPRVTLVQIAHPSGFRVLWGLPVQRVLLATHHMSK